jgi:hypothetical protein
VPLGRGVRHRRERRRVVVDPRVDQHTPAVRRRATAAGRERVDAAGLDVDAGYLRAEVGGEGGELDGAAPGARLADRGEVGVDGLAENRGGVGRRVGADGVCDDCEGTGFSFGGRRREWDEGRGVRLRMAWAWEMSCLKMRAMEEKRQELSSGTICGNVSVYAG